MFSTIAAASFRVYTAVTDSIKIWIDSNFWNDTEFWQE